MENADKMLVIAKQRDRERVNNRIMVFKKLHGGLLADLSEKIMLAAEDGKTNLESTIALTDTDFDTLLIILHRHGYKTPRYENGNFIDYTGRKAVSFVDKCDVNEFRFNISWGE